MPSDLLIALLGFLGTVIGSVIGVFTSARLTNYRIEQLEKKMDAIADNRERIAILEQRMNHYEQSRKTS